MATLEKIRNKAGLLVAVVGVALLAFILGDFLNSGSTFFRQQQEKVAVVDGVSVNYQTYQNRIEEMLEMYKMQSGSNNVPDEYQNQIRQSVFDAIVREIVLDEELEKLGIQVSSDELFDMVQGENISPVIQGMPMFSNPQTGMFDKNLMLNFLKVIDEKAIQAASPQEQSELISARNFWLFWEKNIKRQRLEEKYLTLLTKSMAANKLDAEAAHKGESEKSDILYVKQPYTSIPDSAVQVSKAEIEKLYNERKEQFKQAETKVITYISKPIVPSEEDYDLARQDVDKLREELMTTEQVAEVVNEYSETPYIDAFVSTASMDMYLRDFAATASLGDVSDAIFENDQYRVFKLVDKTVAPDSVKFSHIMLAPGATEEATKQLVDSLLTELKGGADFGLLAAQFSVDQTRENGGEVGWFTEPAAVLNLGADFAKTLFSTAVNNVVEVKSTYGIHLVKVTGKTANVNKYKLAHVLMTVTPSSDTYSKIYNDLNKFITTNRVVAQLDTAATSAGYDVFTNTHLTANDQTVGGHKNSRQVVRWAFENKKGSISDIFECEDVFVIAAVQGTMPEGYRSLQSVESLLKPELIAKKKGEMIVENLKAKNLTSLDAYANAMDSSIDSVRFVTFNTSRISGIGLEPKLNAHISLSPVNQLSEPIAGNGGVYVYTVFNRTTDEATENEAEQIQNQEGALAYRVGYQAIQLLVSKAKVEDNRIRFY